MFPRVFGSALLRQAIAQRSSQISIPVCSSSGVPGSGMGHGGSGGSVRAAGGKFGEMEQAREDQYFRKMQVLQLENLKKDLAREISHHENQIKYHQAAIDRHAKRHEEIDAEKKNHS